MPRLNKLNKCVAMIQNPLIEWTFALIRGINVSVKQRRQNYDTKKSRQNNVWYKNFK